MPVPIVIDQIQIRSLDIDNYQVSWSVETTTVDLLDFSFQLFRSEAAMGPFDAISPPMDDRYFFIDNKIRIGHDLRTWFYKVRVTEKASGDFEEFGPATPGPDADLVAKELRLHMNLLFREFIGRRCWVLPVRTFGQRCGNCWNPIMQKRTKSGCLTCFDTGFVRGYHSPIETWINFDPTQRGEQNSNIGPTTQQNTTAKLGYFPPLKPRDVVVEPENIRWRVGAPSQTEHVRVPVHQEIQLHRIPVTDMEYRIQFQIQDALQDLWLSPARNFSNPQNLDNFAGAEYPKFLELYGATYRGVSK